MKENKRNRLRGIFAPMILGLGLLAGARTIEAQTTVILVRHAEKAEAEMEGDPDLSEAGYARARELNRVLSAIELSAVYATPFRRTLETARPAAERNGIDIIETPISETMLQDMVRVLTQDHEGEAVLVVGHGNTIPPLLNLLTGSHYEQLAEDEFDDLWIVTIVEGIATSTRLHYGEPTP